MRKSTTFLNYIHKGPCFIYFYNCMKQEKKMKVGKKFNFKKEYFQY